MTCNLTISFFPWVNESIRGSLIFFNKMNFRLSCCLKLFYVDVSIKKVSPIAKSSSKIAIKKLKSKKFVRIRWVTWMLTAWIQRRDWQVSIFHWEHQVWVHHYAHALLNAHAKIFLNDDHSRTDLKNISRIDHLIW